MELTVEHLSFSYRYSAVLKDVNFSVKEGSLICVLGKNGAGKSTLFRCVLGLLKGYDGVIRVNGQDTRRMGERKLASQIAYIPQNHSPAFSFSVMDMVLMGTTSSFSAFSGPGGVQKKLALEALKMMRIEDLAEHSYSHISGGEQQLVLIARAIAQRAKILIMDEPCANLDYGNQVRVMEELKHLAGRGYLIIQSTHNPEHAFLYGDQALVLFRGTIAAQGKPSKVLTEKLLEEVYGVPIELYEIAESGMKLCMPGKSQKFNPERTEMIHPLA